MFDQKKLVLSLCIAACAAGFIACGEGGGDSNVCKPCQYVTDCDDILRFACVDVMYDGNKFCVSKDACTNKTIDSCTLNDKVIAFETDVDCGGFCADINSGNNSVCANDAKCRVDADCNSGNCDNGKCKFKQCQSNEECGIGLAMCNDDGVCISCMDGIKNNDESDVDCGGWCGATCENTQKCNAPSDCATNQCEGGTCKGQIRKALPDDLMINEVFDSSSKSPAFVLNNNVTACEFIEIASVTTDVVDLNGMTLSLLRTDNDKGETVDIQLSGNLQPKHLLVIHNCEQPLVLPNDASSLTGTKLKLTQNATYDATFVTADGNAGDVTKIPSLAKQDSSYNRTTDYDATTSIELAKEMTGVIAFATPGYCMNGGTYSTGCIPACSNNQKDLFEADKDCGGPCGNKCKNGAMCKVNEDCTSGACGEGGVCSVPTCDGDEQCKGDGAKCDTTNHVCMYCGDGIKNNDESDVDCGGSCSTKCVNGLQCRSNSDCITNECGGDGKCTGEVPEKAKLSDLVINEVLVNADTNKKFTNLNGEKQCEFIEIVNISSKTVDLSSITVHAVNMSETSPKETLNQKLEGYYLPSKHALVMHDLKQCPLSLKSWAQDIDMKDRSLTNEKKYHIYLVDGTEQGPTFEVSETLSSNTNKGHSATLATDLDATSDIVDHKTVSDEFASPGMCANGQSFINNCASTCDNGQIDDGEMGADCGGICSATCANGTKCEKNGDCTSDFCNASKQCADSPCTNGSKDDGEMGVDCGGICSAKCDNGTTCEKASDCTSGYCNDDNVCATAPCTGDEECGKGGKCNAGTCETCDDGVKNGYETGTDCGGGCDNKCAGGEGCDKNEDCLSGVCTEATHTCTVFDCETPGVGDILITEVMGSPDTKKDFDFLTSVKQIEFIEIANTSTRRLDLSKVILKWTNTTTEKSLSLSACLDVRGAVIISKDAIPGLPDGVTNQTILQTNAITNKDPYTFWLETKETTPVIIDEVTRAGESSTGVSQVRNPTLDKTATTLVLSKTATSSVYDNSPGYCTNGTSFESGCTTP